MRWYQAYGGRMRFWWFQAAHPLSRFDKKRKESNRTWTLWPAKLDIGCRITCLLFIQLTRGTNPLPCHSNLCFDILLRSLDSPQPQILNQKAFLKARAIMVKFSNMLGGTAARSTRGRKAFFCSLLALSKQDNLFIVITDRLSRVSAIKDGNDSLAKDSD